MNCLLKVKSPLDTASHLVLKRGRWWMICELVIFLFKIDWRGSLFFQTFRGLSQALGGRSDCALDTRLWDVTTQAQHSQGHGSNHPHGWEWEWGAGLAQPGGVWTHRWGKTQVSAGLERFLVQRGESCCCPQQPGAEPQHPTLRPQPKLDKGRKVSDWFSFISSFFT